MTPEIIALAGVIIRMGVSLGIDIYQLIKDAGFNDADTEQLCAMVDEALAGIRKPTPAP